MPNNKTALHNNHSNPFLVSIVIPAYNASTTLPRTLDSVLAQTYAHLDVIVINDGSQDITLNIATAYAQKDNRIRVINQENKGSSLTRRVGVENAKGTHLFFIDADDTIEANTIETLVSYAQKHPQAEAIATGLKRIAQNNEVKQVRQVGALKVLSGIELYKMKLSFWELWGKLFRLDFLKAHLNSFIPNLFYAEDYFFFVSNLKGIKQLVLTPTSYYHYYEYENSMVKAIGAWENEFLLYSLAWQYVYPLMKISKEKATFDLLNTYNRMRNVLAHRKYSFTERQQKLCSLPHPKGAKLQMPSMSAMEKFRLWLFLNKHFTLFHLVTFYRCYL